MIIRCAEDFLQVRSGWYLTMYDFCPGWRYPDPQICMFQFGGKPEIDYSREQEYSVLINFRSRRIVATPIARGTFSFVYMSPVVSQDLPDLVPHTIVMKDICRPGFICCVNQDICGILDDLPIYAVMENAGTISAIIDVYRHYPGTP